MQYSFALKYLESFLNYERLPFRYQYEFNLHRMRHLLTLFGRPDRAFFSVVVAGTKGKGSTACFLSSILSSHGFKTGLYTSPHLADVRERVQIDGKMISKSDFARLVSLARPRLERAKANLNNVGAVTYFEVLTLLAVLHFAKSGVKFGIFEIGMGGRLDAANALESTMAVLTPISFDHEEHLGNTLSKIAAEKAAVIKPNAMVISGPQSPEARRIIKDEACRTHAELFSYGSEFRTGRVLISQKGSRFDFYMGNDRFSDLTTRLPGRFQIENAATAVAGVCLMSKRFGFPISQFRVRQGLIKAFWPGRFEVIERHGQTVVLDGAHNDGSMKQLTRALREIFPDRKFVFIFGISREKNLARTLPPLSGLVEAWIVTKSGNPRAQEPKLIVEAFAKLNFKKPVFWAGCFSKAARLARLVNRENSILVVTGSLFLVSEARKYFRCPRSI